MFNACHRHGWLPGFLTSVKRSHEREAATDLRAGPLLGKAVELVQVCHRRLPRGAPPPSGEAAKGEEGSKL